MFRKNIWPNGPRQIQDLVGAIQTVPIRPHNSQKSGIFGQLNFFPSFFKRLSVDLDRLRRFFIPAPGQSNIRTPSSARMASSMALMRSWDSTTIERSNVM